MRRSLNVANAVVAIGLGLLTNAALADVTTQSLIHPPSSALFPPLPGAAAQPAPVPAALPAPLLPPPVAPPPAAAPAAQGQMPGNIFAWDNELKEHKAKVGEPAAEFAFHFTNICSEVVTINLVQPSCGCTTVQLPPMPWKIAAGANGEIPVRMTLTGVPGTFFKNLTVFTDKGTKMLMLKTVIEAAAPGPMTEEDRKRNQELVKADRQAVFKGDCVRCHVQPTIGKVGKELYDTACGICHEAPHRATMVPDLHAPAHDTNADFWRLMIADGREGTLMPAFSHSKGGPLSDPQITSLVDFLVKTMPAKAVSTNAAAGTPQHAGN